MIGDGMKSFSLEHKSLDLKTYEDFFRRCPQANILQSAAYGEAKCRVEGFYLERKAIVESGNPIAIYQVLTKRLPFLGTVARINRGPLYLQDGSLFPGDFRRIYRSLYEEWVVKNGCFLQIAPNVQDDLVTSGEMEESCFIKSAEPSWQSGWVSLDQSEESLRKSLQQKWRNMLNKSETMGIELHPVENKKDLDTLLREYDLFMKKRNFQSTSSRLIMAMYRWSPDVLYPVFAKKEGRYLGAIIIVKHGDSCTYLVGITCDEGRKTNANYLLLWNGLLHCRRAGFQWFDVGGIDEIHTPGIAHFKKGLGFVPYRLVGEFEGYRGLRCSLIPIMKKYYYQILKRKIHNANPQKMASKGK